ncbi:hypothetical protein BDY19DRAFT_495250 [Irpex rosettiformis]|uniref:Uncharacterized protein n=1 Tax=Irpex rosettiformis TaxID=378272 RepID=A0ACB8UEH0_9APHY|nr:hypothetical protein BDY19DRAFT_495250 [Irpex rosettiformis]
MKASSISSLVLIVNVSMITLMSTTQTPGIRIISLLYTVMRVPGSSTSRSTYLEDVNIQLLPSRYHVPRSQLIELQGQPFMSCNTPRLYRPQNPTSRNEALTGGIY